MTLHIPNDTKLTAHRTITSPLIHHRGYETSQITIYHQQMK